MSMSIWYRFSHQNNTQFQKLLLDEDESLWTWEYVRYDIENKIKLHNKPRNNNFFLDAYLTGNLYNHKTFQKTCVPLKASEYIFPNSYLIIHRHVCHRPKPRKPFVPYYRMKEIQKLGENANIVYKEVKQEIQHENETMKDMSVDEKMEYIIQNSQTKINTEFSDKVKKAHQYIYHKYLPTYPDEFSHFTEREVPQNYECFNCGKVGDHFKKNCTHVRKTGIPQTLRSQWGNSFQ